VNKKRPINLNLFTIRQPIPAIVSILHRISGVVLFLLIPVMLWALETSLASQVSFNQLHDDFSQPLAKVLVWLFIAPFLFHFVAGIRHLLMDINIGIELNTGRLTAIVTAIIALILIILSGVYIW
jgi:succinate dehydrogenase / fumarate reductase, cytochrome b subunit